MRNEDYVKLLLIILSAVCAAMLGFGELPEPVKIVAFSFAAGSTAGIAFMDKIQFTSKRQPTRVAEKFTPAQVEQLTNALMRKRKEEETDGN